MKHNLVMKHLYRLRPFLAVLAIGAATAAGRPGDEPAKGQATPVVAARPATSVVLSAVENVYLRPDETGPVDDQVILGDRLDVVEETAGFTRIRKPEGGMGWLPSRALLRTPAEDTVAPETEGGIAEVLSPWAHVYRDPDFTSARPLLTLPLGARVRVRRELAKGGHEWIEALLPDGRRGFVARPDLEIPRQPREVVLEPASWIAMGRRFLGAPYTWGGTTPNGFDCSGLVFRVLERHGVRLKRNSFEQCFRDPQLVPIAFSELRPGDLLFFGTEDRVDHEAMWIGDGKVLQASAHGVPGTQITVFEESPRLKERFRYARRLAMLKDARPPAALSAGRLASLEKTLRALSEGSGATFGIVFRELGAGKGRGVLLGEARAMHAASTMKTPVMLEVLRRVDAGELRLEDEIEVKNEFRSVVDSSPYTLTVDPETDGPTAAHIGKKAPLGLLVREMIVRSSNLATNVVLSLVGPESVKRLLDKLGASSVKVRRGVEDIKAYEKNLNNETDALGMATVMEAAVTTPLLSAKAKATAWSILTGQVFNEQIPAGLHPQSGAVVAHKTGTISSVQHDAAIVRLPDGREYVLVLLANDFGANEAGRKRVIEASRKMSRAVWEAMIAP